MNNLRKLELFSSLFVGLFLCISLTVESKKAKKPVDYVNPYIGNISLLLVPTFPTIHLPNSILRVYPEREDFIGDRIKGLPLIVISHRGISAFNLSPYQGDEAGIKSVITYSYDNEKIKPYYYTVCLDEQPNDISSSSHHSVV